MTTLARFFDDAWPAGTRVSFYSNGGFHKFARVRLIYVIAKTVSSLVQEQLSQVPLLQHSCETSGEHMACKGSPLGSKPGTLAIYPGVSGAEKAVR